jgi:hypothetical protein
MNLSYFSWIPNVEVKGSSTQKIESTTLDSIIVNSKSIKIILNEAYAQKSQNRIDHDIINFNIKPGIHSFSQPEETQFPLELAYAYSIDLLENLSIQKSYSTIIYSHLPNSLVDGLFGLNKKAWLPFLVRRPNKTLYSSVFLMTPISGNLLTSLEAVSDQYEDYIENALYTFNRNVIKPLQKQEASNSPEDLIRVLDRTEDLYSIIVTQLSNIRDRYRAFSRLIVPLIHYANLKSDLEDSVSFSHDSESSFNYEIKTPLEVESTSIATFLAKKLAD